MRAIYTIILALLMSTTIVAQTDSIHVAIPSWDEANAAYANGEWNEALEAYEAIAAFSPTADVYYNMGNAYFKKGELGRSILSYERCLRLDPGHADAINNRDFVAGHIIDNIKPAQPSFLSQWSAALRDSLSERSWFFTSVTLFLVALVGIFLFAFMMEPHVRRAAFFGAVFAFLFSMIAMTCGISSHTESVSHDEAIIMQGIVNAKSSPDRSGTDLFVLHEGTKVEITDAVGEWYEITVGDNVGWIRATTLERI